MYDNLEESQNVIKFSDDSFELDVVFDKSNEKVLLNQMQISELFEKDRSVVTKHINNAIKDGEVCEVSNVQKMHIANSDKLVKFYDLDVIISVGYRVKSKRGVLFRKWATSVLREYLMNGIVVDKKKISESKIIEMIEYLNEIKNSNELTNFNNNDIFEILALYNQGIKLLDDYDHNRLEIPVGRKKTIEISYDECMKVINKSVFKKDNSLFGKERDESFKSSISTIFQTFGGVDLYDSLELKAANLLYLITKNHSFIDGNKRIAVIILLLFMSKNDILLKDNKILITPETFTTLTLLVASSDATDKDRIIDLIMVIITKYDEGGVYE